jgi:probable F420-dependent oxidoreductase
MATTTGIADADVVEFPELGFYLLGGQPTSARPVLDEVRQAEEMGLGMAFISERYNLKEVGAICGAVGAVTSRIGIQTAATNHNTRHPLVTAGFARTMQSLTDGRFTLGLGRGVALMQDTYGIPRITTAQIEDFVGLMRRLFHGEAILGHEGPAGSWPVLHLDSTLDEHLPMSFVAIGPRSLELGGRCFDDVILHTYFTDEATRRCVRAVKDAAEKVGRDPDDVRVWSCFATIGDHIPEQLRIKKSVGRLATYLQGYGDLMIEVNQWDPGVLERFRADPVVQSVPGAIDGVGTPEQLEHIATLLPADWLAPSATGTPDQCASAVRHQLEIGCDGVIMHGATPTELTPIVDAYRASSASGTR